MTPEQYKLLKPDERHRLIEELKVEREILRRHSYKDLSSHLRLIWPILEPKNKYIHNWHIDAIADHMSAVRRFEITKLIVNMPPRCAKSLLISVGFNTWVWTTEAFRRFIYAAYSQSVANRDALKCRDVVEHPLYQELYQPTWEIRDDQNTKEKFMTTETGFRFSTSVTGRLTGEGADYALGDDLQNKMEIRSAAYREETHSFLGALASRSNNISQFAQVIIQQRLHEDDITGREMKADKGWEILRLPMEFNPTVMSYTSLKFKDPRTKEGELLWPARFPSDKVRALEKDLGDSSFAELQQDPKPASGGLFKKGDWQYYDKSPSDILELVQIWDCAQKPGITNDFSVCATWARTTNAYYLLHLWREQTTAPMLEAMVLSLYDRFRPNGIVVEDKSAGSSLIQYLQLQTTLPVIPYNPKVDKETRASAATPTHAAKKLFLPTVGFGFDTTGKVDLMKTFIDEHERFPRAAHDDTVDTTSMMVSYFQTRSLNGPRIRSF